ncbi:hypothetical protein [Rudaeicoccus suwonensis]|uniref:hypothetical protein n=1 Tax=Rudaeicoccus suwonensis TaxID=657409 RepID=UPI0011A1D93C|nr:hypothetical protein [Rudaeicoccus suwonensis]
MTVLVTVLGAGTASAVTSPVAGNGVGASTVTGQSRIGLTGGRVIVDVDDVDFHADDGVLTVIATLTTDGAVDSTVISELAARLERAAREVYVLIGTLIVVIKPRGR